jgi:hypothetical protein
MNKRSKTNWVLPKLCNSDAKRTGFILKLGKIEAKQIGLYQNLALEKRSELVLF